MRIWGVRVPPGYLEWSAVGLGILLLGILSAALANTLGLYGFSRWDEDTGTRVIATVSAGVPCDVAGDRETVTFTTDGRERRAQFDGCGHAEGEQVEITVPPGASGEDLVVHAAQAAVGDGVRGEGLGVLLLVFSSLAGAAYAFLVRRGPRGTPLRLAGMF